MNWIVSISPGRSCELPCSILAASIIIRKPKRKSHLARLSCKSRAHPRREPGALVCQYRSHLRGNFSVDRLLPADGGRHAATRRTGRLPGGAAGCGAAELRALLSRAGDPRHEDRVPPLRTGALDIRPPRLLPLPPPHHC